MATRERIDKSRTLLGSGVIIRWPGRPCHVVRVTETDVGLPRRSVNALCDTVSCRIEAFGQAFIIDVTMRSRLGSICSSVKKLLPIGQIDKSPPFRYRCRPRAYDRCRLYRYGRTRACGRYPKPQRDRRRHLGSYDDPVGRHARRRSDVQHRTPASLSSAPRVTEPAPPACLGSPPRIGPGRAAVMGP